jgi:RNA 2',3'-cyclic 3'-phosphodiesterase
MRLFIATTFPAEVLQDLNARVTAVRPRLPAGSWVRQETQHLTLAFLGEQAESLVERIAAPLTDALAKVPSFEATIRDCGFFPNPRRARVGWAGLDPEAKFGAVARAVREVVTKNGVQLDGGEFRAHLTLVRLRDPWPPASIDLFNRTLREFRSEPFPVRSVTLYASQLHPNGAIHTPQREFALGGVEN